jgi:hypothetical protein
MVRPMKYLFLFLAAAFLVSSISYAQFKDDRVIKPTIRDGVINDSENTLFGIFDPAKFSMSHTVGMSYSSFGGNGIALGTYTNSMAYQFSDNLNIQIDASLVTSPYSSYGEDFQNDISGIYLSRAQINYEPWENTRFVLQFRQIPNAGYYPYYNRYNRGYSDMFSGNDFMYP